MIVWEVVRKIAADVDKEAPDLTEEQRNKIVWEVYNELERRVLCGIEGSSPIGVLTNFYPFTGEPK